MAHKTTPEENYSGLTEEGFEQWTVDWSEFYDFVAEHKGEKLDITIDATSAEEMQEEFDNEEIFLYGVWGRGDDATYGIVDKIAALGFESKSIIVRLPYGLKSLGNFSDLSGDIPDSILNIYLPPTFYERIQLNTKIKDIFVVPSNLTYITDWREVSDDEEYDEGKYFYNDDEGEANFKTYKTSATHFPAGKYVITFDSFEENLSTKWLYVFHEDCPASKIAQAIIDDDCDDIVKEYLGTNVEGATLKIKNVTTGQIWEIQCEGDCDGAEFYFDGVQPCFKIDDKTIMPEDFYTSEVNGHVNYIGEADIEDEDNAVDFPNGFNFGDIRFQSVCSENADVYIVALTEVKGVIADLGDFEENSYHNIHIKGAKYDYDDLEDFSLRE